jgi:hypothetical protein
VRGLATSAGELASMMPEADALFARWEPIFSEDEAASEDFGHRFWRLLFQNYFEPKAVLDLTGCSPLGAFHKRRCRRALSKLYLRRVQQVIRHEQELYRFCEVKEEDLEQIPLGALEAPPYRAIPDPLFTELLRSIYDHVCTQKKPLPVKSTFMTEEDAFETLQKSEN